MNCQLMRLSPRFSDSIGQEWSPISGRFTKLPWRSHLHKRWSNQRDLESCSPLGWSLGGSAQKCWQEQNQVKCLRPLHFLSIFHTAKLNQSTVCCSACHIPGSSQGRTSGKSVFFRKDQGVLCAGSVYKRNSSES